MLNFIYWPISAILWFWHWLLSFVMDPSSGITWAISIILLTFTVRIVMVKPTINMMRSQRKMQEMQPRMQEIREKYKNDQVKMMEESRKLQKEMGGNPLLGCLPMLVQIPVFLGLFHVLRSFNRDGSFNQPELSPEVNRNTPNYIFGVDEVQSFLDARLFGVPLSSYITMPQTALDGFLPNAIERWNVIVVAVPLIIIIVLATHFNARMSVSRQKQRLADGRQTAPTSGPMAGQMQMMNTMMMWFMPLTILFTGFIWQIGLLLYMMSNNVWTFFQQRYVFKKMDEEELAELEAKKAAKRSTAPKPGVKPVNPKKGGKRAQQNPQAQQNQNAEVTESAEEKPTPTASSTPKPGVKPNNPKRKGKKKKKR